MVHIPLPLPDLACYLSQHPPPTLTRPHSVRCRHNQQHDIVAVPGTCMPFHLAWLMTLFPSPNAPAPPYLQLFLLPASVCVLPPGEEVPGPFRSFPSESPQGVPGTHQIILRNFLFLGSSPPSLWVTQRRELRSVCERPAQDELIQVCSVGLTTTPKAS